MSTLRVDNIKSRTGTAVTIPSGQSFDVTGDLNVTGSANLNSTGVITATSFVGSGSALTGIAATDNIITSGIVTITNTTNSTSTTTGALKVSGGVGVALSMTVGGSLSVGGTITYEDVTNVDSVGLITARSGIQFGVAGVGGTIRANGDTTLVGVVTATSFVGDLTGAVTGNADTATNATNATNVTVTDESTDTTCFPLFVTTNTGTIPPKVGTNLTFDSADGKLTATQFIGVATGGTASGASVGVGTTATIIQVTDGATQNSFAGVLVEKASIQATNVSSGTIDLAQGNVHYFTTNGSGSTTAAIKYKGGNNLSAYMKVGDNISVSIISKPNNSEYVSAVTIDGAAVTEEWGGGTTPSSASGAASSYTITTINITRFAATGTPNSDYLVLCNVLNYA